MEDTTCHCTWNSTVAFTFCEGQYLENIPINGIKEFGNTISSVALLLFGLLGTYGSLKSGPLVQCMYSFLIIDGIGSALFHATFFLGWKMMDEIPMIMMISFGNILLLDELFRIFIIKEFWYLVLSNTATTLFTLYAALTITLDFTSGDNPTVFRVLFALPFVFIIIGLLLIWIHRDDFPLPKNNYLILKQDQSTFKRDCFILVWYSIGSGLVATTAWILDSTLCTKVTVYFYLHAWWHILIAYNAYCMISLISFLRAANWSHRATLSWILYIIPLVKWEK